jgi:hypothetical protein
LSGGMGRFAALRVRLSRGREGVVRVVRGVKDGRGESETVYIALVSRRKVVKANKDLYHLATLRCKQK